MSTSFYYFGFGSNLLAKRINLQNPTAKRVGVGRLDDFRLDFNSLTRRWKGAPATIVPDENEQVFGAIWEIHIDNLKDLDKQEGVEEGIYVPINVPVYAVNQNKIISCRAYHLKRQPETRLKDFHYDDVPADRQPSLTYLKTIVQGAQETGVPQHYINWLCSIKHNGAIVDEFEKVLGLNAKLK